MFNTEDVFHAAGSELLTRRGHELTPEIVGLMMGRRAEESFTALKNALDLKEDIHELLAESTEIFRGLLDQILAPMPGLFDLLNHIEDVKLPKGVATSSSRPYLNNILGRYDLHDRFHVMLTAEDVSQGKPHPEIYLTAANSLGISPSEMLVLEDSEAGTRAAAAAEAVVVSIPHKHSQSQDFSEASYIADSLVDPWILDVINQK
ncbi:MAG: HAD-IA family hydrolase [Planctomycetaceae bacterium]